MAILESALAFAITMLVLSMSSSVIVETIHRLGRLREAGLKLMLRHLFDKIIKPHLERVLGAGSTKVDALRQQFLDELTANRAPGGEARIRNALLQKIWNGEQLRILKVGEFMEKLASSDVAKHLVDGMVKGVKDETVAKVEDAIKDIAQKFEAFGREVSVYFEARARLLGVVVAIPFAWILYVDAIHLFKTFLREPETRANVIAQYDDVTNTYLKQVQEAAATIKAGIKEKHEAPDAKKALEALQSSVEDVKKAVAKAKVDLTSQGVPIGWTEQRRDAENAYIFFATVKWLPTVYVPTNVTALFGLLLGGLLIGLGAPFWFDMVKSLWNIRRVTSAARDAGALDQTTDTRHEQKPDSAQPTQPLEIFRIAYEARHGKLT